MKEKKNERRIKNKDIHRDREIERQAKNIGTKKNIRKNVTEVK